MAGDARAVERIVREATGRRRASCASCAPTPASSRSSRSGSTARAEPRRRARARERDRGADPARGARDRRRDRPHRAVGDDPRAARWHHDAMRLCMFSPKEMRARARLARADRRRPRRPARRADAAGVLHRRRRRPRARRVSARRLRPAPAGPPPADRAGVRAVRARRHAVLLLPEHRSRSRARTTRSPYPDGTRRARLRPRRSPP